MRGLCCNGVTVTYSNTFCSYDVTHCIEGTCFENSISVDVCCRMRWLSSFAAECDG